MILLGLDVGTTGCKAMVFDEGGSPISHAYREYDRAVSASEIDPEALWDCVCEVVRAAAAASAEPVTAVGISSFGESFVAMGGDGRPLADVMLYTDPRGAAQCQRYVETLGQARIMQLSGLKPHPMYSLAKMGYLRDERPEVFGAAHKFLLMEDFVIWRLTGEYCIDYSLASRTMGFNVTTMGWEPELLGLAGVDESRLSKPVPSGTVAGPVLPHVAVSLGLPKGTLVVTGGHDQVCAATGAGILQEGRAIDGTGTVECITPAFGRPILSKAFLGSNFACVPHSVPGMYVTYAFNFTGGSLLKWYRDNFARHEVAIAKAKGISAYRLLDELGSRQPTGILVIPHFAGSGTPELDPRARGAFLGLDFDTDAATLYRALIEGVTYEMAYNMEILEKEGVRISELRAVGGGAKSDYWLHIKAAVTGRRIAVLDVEEAGAAGAAMLAGVAAGAHRSIEEAAEHFVRIERVIEPDSAQAGLYHAMFQQYKRARQSVAQLYANDAGGAGV